jgi:hypothetical protein
MAMRRLTGRSYIARRYEQHTSVRVLDAEHFVILGQLNPRWAELEDIITPPGPRLDWGGLTGGCPRLAFALCVDATDDVNRSLQFYSYLLAVVCARLPRPGFILLASDIREFIETIEQRHERGLGHVVDRMLSKSYRPALAGAR